MTIYLSLNALFLRIRISLNIHSSKTSAENCTKEHGVVIPQLNLTCMNVFTHIAGQCSERLPGKINGWNYVELYSVMSRLNVTRCSSLVEHVLKLVII